MTRQRVKQGFPQNVNPGTSQVWRRRARRVAETAALPACGCSALTEGPAPCRSRDPPERPTGKPRCLRLRTSQRPRGPSEPVLCQTAAKTETKTENSPLCLGIFLWFFPCAQVPQDTAWDPGAHVARAPFHSLDHSKLPVK